MTYTQLILSPGMRHAPGIWGFGILHGLIANTIVIIALAIILYWLLKGSRKRPETANDALKMRLARGEIDEDEYRRVKKLLEE